MYGSFRYSVLSKDHKNHLAQIYLVIDGEKFCFNGYLKPQTLEAFQRKLGNHYNELKVVTLTSSVRRVDAYAQFANWAKERKLKVHNSSKLFLMFMTSVSLALIDYERSAKFKVESPKQVEDTIQLEMEI